MRLKKIISLSLALLTGILVFPIQLFAAKNFDDLTTMWSNPRSSSVISQGDIYYLEKKGSSVYPEKYKFKADGSDGDGIPTNSQLVMQDGKVGPIVPPWEQFYDGLTPNEKKEYILVRDKITITKKDKSGKPLNGIVFQIDKRDVCTTDVQGQCTITFPDNKWGPMDLVETIEKDTNHKSKYKNKTIKLYRDPGTRFLGEVSGEELDITYDELRKEVRDRTNKTEKELPKPSITKSQSQLIYDKNDREEYNGGIWLKFIDRDQFDKIHVFYVAKRPILKNISWNDIYTAGMVYGWDVIDPHTGLPKSNSEKYSGNGKPYRAYLREIEGKKYIVRLLQGKTNYGGGMTNQEICYNDNSEWNRTILPLVQSYRFGRYSDRWSYAEDILRQSDGNADYSLRKYVTNTAQYNWFGDLTLGAFSKFQYGGKTIATGTTLNGQLSWTQDYACSAIDRFYRGSSNIGSGAADSNSTDARSTDKNWGFRPVLEVAPKEYDGVVFEGEVTGNELGITYDELRKKVRDKTNKTEETLPKPSITEAQSKLLYDLNDYEEKNGGMWLKFTDYTYTRDGKPRTFYVAKKPILKKISYNDIVNSGMAYGWDIIDPNTNKFRSNLIQFDKTALNNYNPTIINNNQQYIVRLLRGRSNYGNPITKNSNNQDYKWKDAPNSEWNRTIVAITQQYRGESSSMEQALKDGNSGTQWVGNNYKNQTAQYNWFGDLTLGAWESFNYKNVKDTVSSVYGQGQYSWVQEYSAAHRSFRGGDDPGRSAAYSGDSSDDGRSDDYGFRPVLEPFNN